MYGKDISWCTFLRPQGWIPYLWPINALSQSLKEAMTHLFPQTQEIHHILLRDPIFSMLSLTQQRLENTMDHPGCHYIWNNVTGINCVIIAKMHGKWSVHISERIFVTYCKLPVCDIIAMGLLTRLVHFGFAGDL